MGKFSSFCAFFLLGASALVFGSSSFSCALIAGAAGVVFLALAFRFPGVLRFVRVYAFLALAALVFEFAVFLYRSVSFDGITFMTAITVLCVCAFLVYAGEKPLLFLCELALPVVPVCMALLYTSLSNTANVVFMPSVNAYDCLILFALSFVPVICVSSFFTVRRQNAVWGYATGCAVSAAGALLGELLFSKVNYVAHPLETASRICTLPLNGLVMFVLFAFFVVRVVFLSLCAYKYMRTARNGADDESGDEEHVSYRKNNKGHPENRRKTARKSEHQVP